MTSLSKKTNKRTVISFLKDVKYILCALFIVGIIVGCLFPLPTAYAFEGTEQAGNASEFKDTNEQNMYKMWSIFKSCGMTDAQAVGIIANFKAEGGMNPVYMELQHSVSVGGSSDIEKAQWFAEHHTEYTIEVLRWYGLTDEQIEEAKYDTGYSVRTTDKSGHTADHNAGFYFVGKEHEGYCGIGVGQWTGENAKELIHWCEERNLAWYTIDTQIGWMIMLPENGGSYYAEYFENYMDETEGSEDPEECAKQWCEIYERPSNIEDEKSKRAGIATSIYPDFKGKGWDAEYGQKIVEGSGFTPATFDYGIQDVGLEASISMVTMQYPRNVGFLLFNEPSVLEEKNENVYAGYVKRLNGETDTSPKYSLYELYGEDVHWMRYMGEMTYYPQLYDHIYSAYAQDKLNYLSLTDIFYKANNYLSCSVYAKRPIVLSTGDLHDGYKDPRTSEVFWGRFNGYPYEAGSLNLTIAKYITAFVTVLLGGDVLKFISDTVTAIETSATWTALTPLVYLLMGFGSIALICSLVKKCAKFAKGQDAGGFKDIFGRFLVGALCLGFMWASVLNPTGFNRLFLTGTTIVDNIFNASIADTFENDDIIGVHDVSLATKAAVWKIAIFQPWCRGQFDGMMYDELYTTYATKLTENQSAMPQSNDTVDTSDKTGKAFYNSALYTGDVYVPLGGGKDVRNWAAYLYSCGSQYHIDSLVETDRDRSPTIQFPMANTTFGNPEILADTFRVVDATYNISPQHYADGSISYNYADAKKMDTHFIREGLTAIFNSVLLLMLLPAIFQKFKNFFILVISAFEIIYFMTMELFKENSGVKDLLETIKKAFVNYISAVIRIYIMVILYMSFADQGFIKALIFIILCLVVYGFNIKDARKFVSDAKHTAGKVKNRYFMENKG